MKMIKTLRFWLGFVAAVTLIGCATSPDMPDAVVREPTALIVPTPTPPKPAAPSALALSSMPSFGPPGVSSLQERIASADLIIRAEVGSVRHVIDSGRVLNMTTGRYGPTEYSKALEYTFTVHEYLQGSGAAEVKGLALDAWYRYPTVAEAEASGPDNLSARDSQWEDREGIFFLGEFPSSQTHRAGRYFFGVFRGGVGEVDMYSIASKYSKRWLPATTGSSDDSGGSGARQGTTETGEREYLLDEPTALSGGASGATAQQMSAPTITLTALKAEIAAIAAEVAAGDGTEAYEKCIFLKYRNIRQSDASLARALGRQQPIEIERFALGSGLAMGARVNPRNINYDSPTSGSLEGRDSDLFEVNPIGVVKTLRPLPAGEYGFTYLERSPELDPCDAPIPESAKKYRQYVVDVTAPAGALHEAFFDPVSVGTAVKADGTNGVLEPASFTDANAAAATLQSISYEPPTGSGAGTVKLQVDPHTGLGGHRLDFIELDGSVSLSLDADAATVDAPNNTLSWSVTSPPWDDGDKLMLRIAEEEPEIALLNMPTTITLGQSDTFTVRASGLSAAESYRIRLSSSNDAVGFARGCGIGGKTVSVPSGSTSHRLEETLHGCRAMTGTVTATLLRRNGELETAIGTASASVEVESASSVTVTLSARTGQYFTWTDMTVEWTDATGPV